ncbi:MAG: hypothetical protein ACLUD0_17710 [Eubacterium ramulus]
MTKKKFGIKRSKLTGYSRGFLNQKLAVKMLKDAEETDVTENTLTRRDTRKKVKSACSRRGCTAAEETGLAVSGTVSHIDLSRVASASLTIGDKNFNSDSSLMKEILEHYSFSGLCGSNRYGTGTDPHCRSLSDRDICLPD